MQSFVQIFSDPTSPRYSWPPTLPCPPPARDLDDALSIEPLGEGRWRVGVHIADVASFVKPGTALDDEALLRGTSV